MDVIKKKYPIIDENGRSSTYPTFASQVFFDDGTVLEGKRFGGVATIDPLTIYPVGSIYMSANETSPAALFGGTWESIGGRFLLGADGTYPAGSTGGEATHKLTEDELPALRGTINIHGGENGSNYWNPVGVFSGSQIVNKYRKFSSTTETVASSITGLDFSAGNDMPHNNMPPWEAVNIWKRVA